MVNKTKHYALLCIALIVILFGLIFIAINTGTIKVTFMELIRGLFIEYNEKVASIYHIRFPRIVIAVLVGASLAIAGCLFQAVLKNPLADPGMIGVSSGCQLAMAICLLFLPQHYYLKPFYGFIGGCFAFVIIYLLSYHSGFQPVRILLIGVALHYFFSSLLDIFSSTGIDNVSVNALLGSQIASQTWNDVLQVGIYLFPLLLLTSFTYKTCDLFALEEKTLISLGVNVTLKRFLLAILAVMLVSVSVTLAGTISFIGLLIPHMARVLVGSKHQRLFVVSGLLGSITLLLADTWGRALFAPMEVSAGILLSLIGAPLFILLIRRSQL